jgi:flagellar biosynthesis/type III secretory pathway protein FliH
MIIPGLGPAVNQELITNVLGKLPEVNVKPSISQGVNPKAHTLAGSLGIQLIPDPTISDLNCHIAVFRI